MEKRRTEKESIEEKKTKKNEGSGGNQVFASFTFESLGLRHSLCKELKETLGFEVPTHIQGQAIPVILSGKHVLVNAPTGTGKTIVYLAPVVHHLLDFD